MSDFIEKVLQLERSPSVQSLSDETIDDIKNQILAEKQAGKKEMTLKFKPIGGTPLAPGKYAKGNTDFSPEIRRWLIANKFSIFADIEEVERLCGQCLAYDGHGDMGCGRICKRTERKTVWKMLLE